jgi:hypothetical protein
MPPKRKGHGPRKHRIILEKIREFYPFSHPQFLWITLWVTPARQRFSLLVPAGFLALRKI